MAQALLHFFQPSSVQMQPALAPYPNLSWVKSVHSSSATILLIPGFCMKMALISSLINVHPPLSMPGPIFSFLFAIALSTSLLASRLIGPML